MRPETIFKAVPSRTAFVVYDGLPFLKAVGK
jgi:hypothetical protein